MTHKTNAETTKELLDTLSAEVEALRTSEGWMAWLEVAKRFHRYSPNNQMLIAWQCPEATHVMGYGSKDKSTGWLSLGRQVRKGEKAIYILAPIVRKVRNEKTGEDEPRVVGFRGASVFDVSQTDGEPLPASPAELWEQAMDALPVGERDEAIWDALRAAVESLGLNVVIEEERMGGALGWWLPGTKDVHVVRREFGLMAGTLAHEAGHALDPALNPSDYDQNELVAESVSWLLSARLGFPKSEVSAIYLAHFGGTTDTLEAVANRVKKVAEKVLDALDAKEEVSA